MNLNNFYVSRSASVAYDSGWLKGDVYPHSVIKKIIATIPVVGLGGTLNAELKIYISTNPDVDAVGTLLETIVFDSANETYLRGINYLSKGIKFVYDPKGCTSGIFHISTICDEVE